MQNSNFVTECNVIRLYYENAEANIVNDLFFETAEESADPSKIEQIAHKVVAKINEIIEKIKEFFRDLKRKHESAKIERMLKSECARSQKLIKANVKDKEISKAVATVYKLQQRSFAEVRKVYDAFMSHKIDYDTYCEKMGKINEQFSDAIEKVQKDMDNVKIINTNTALGQYKLSELTKRVYEVQRAYTKVIDQMEDDIIKEEEKLSVAAKRVVNDNTEATATSKMSAFLSKINKKAVIAVVSIASIAGAAAFCYKAGVDRAYREGNESGYVEGYQRGHWDTINESAEDDYFADLIGDSYDDYQESSYDDSDESGIFDDILDM